MISVAPVSLWSKNTDCEIKSFVYVMFYSQIITDNMAVAWLFSNRYSMTVSEIAMSEMIYVAMYLVEKRNKEYV